MADISVNNTTTQLSGKTVLVTENDQTVTGLQTFDRDPSAPFAVTASSAVVTNLDADKLDGQDGAAYATLVGVEVLTNKTLTNPTVNAGSGTIVLPNTTVPAQTAEGSIVWDSDDDVLTVGDGASRKTMCDTAKIQTLTNKTLTAPTITAPAITGATTIGNGATITTPVLTGAITGVYSLQGTPTVWNVITTTSTGAQNDFAPGLIGNTHLRCNNASLLTISGFTGGYAGQRLLISSVGAGQVDFTHQTLSTAANQLFNCATSGNTSLAAGSGTAEYVYDATTTRWRLIAHEQGGWITRTFAAGNYTATAGTWTVASATRDAYQLRGRTLVFSFSVSGTTSTVPVTVKITLPFTAAGTDTTTFYNQNPGTGTAEGGYCNSATTTLNLQRFNNTAYAAGTVTVSGEIQVEVT